MPEQNEKPIDPHQIHADRERLAAARNQASIAASRFQNVASRHGLIFRGREHAERSAEVILAAKSDRIDFRLREAAAAFLRLMAEYRSAGGEAELAAAQLLPVTGSTNGSIEDLDRFLKRKPGGRR